MPLTRSNHRAVRAWGAVLAVSLLVAASALAAIPSHVTGALPAAPPFMRIVVVERAHFAEDDGAHGRLAAYLRASEGIAVVHLVSLETGRTVTIKALDRPPGDLEAAVHELFERGRSDSPRLQLATRTVGDLIESHRNLVTAYARMPACKQDRGACETYARNIEIVVAGSTFHRDHRVDFRTAVPSEGCYAVPSNPYRDLTHPETIAPRTWPDEPSMPSLDQRIRLVIAVDLGRGRSFDARPRVVEFFNALARTQHYEWAGVIDLNDVRREARYAQLRTGRDGPCLLVPAGDPGAPPGKAQDAPELQAPPVAEKPARDAPKPVAGPDEPPVDAKPGQATPQQPVAPVESPRTPAQGEPTQQVGETIGAPPNLDPTVKPAAGEPTVTVRRATPVEPDPPRDVKTEPKPAEPPAPNGAGGDLANLAAPPLRAEELAVTVRWASSAAFDIVGSVTLTDTATGRPAPSGVASFGFPATAGMSRFATGRFAIGGARGGAFAVGFRIEEGRCTGTTERLAQVAFERGRSVAVEELVDGGPVGAPDDLRLRLVCENGRPRVAGPRIGVRVR